MNNTEYMRAIDSLANRCGTQERPFLSDLLMAQEIFEAVQFANEHSPLPQRSQDALTIVAAELLRRGFEDA